jgi:hypothetical protein
LEAFWNTALEKGDDRLKNHPIITRGWKKHNPPLLAWGWSRVSESRFFDGLLLGQPSAANVQLIFPFPH